MGFETVLTALCLVFALSEASMVEVVSEWRPNFGWEVVCSWQLYANDSLQSVRLYRFNQQFMIYRPERDGPKQATLVRLTNLELTENCLETKLNGVEGKCIISLEILQPVTDDMSFTCEVSGERPTFRVESKTVNVEALVPPSAAIVEEIYKDNESGRVTINCTSAGMPAPKLEWTILDQTIPQDFSGRAWNVTSKLYHVWSSLSYTPRDSTQLAVCSPRIEREGKTYRGQKAYHSAARGLGSSTTVILCIVSMLFLTR